MNKNTPTTDDEAIRLHYANNIANNANNVVSSTAMHNTNYPLAPLPSSVPKSTRLRMGKVKGESKAARRLRRRAVVG